MKKTTQVFAFIIFGLFALIAITGFFRFHFINGRDIIPENKIPDVKNMSYVIGGETFLLKNGKAEKEITQGSATKNKLMVFGEPIYGDLNGDGKKDVAILLANNTGGSGIFYYAVLAISNGMNYTPTTAMLLGDRIAPQTVEIHNGRAVYNFAERKETDPMTAQPSIGKSVWVHYDPKTNEIGEWVKDFEGESDLPITI